MALRLPRWENLSPDEQVPIVNLPLNKTFVVTGGPGTGKTVLAIYRAEMLQAGWKEKVGGEIKFLVFNKPLMRYLKAALDEKEIDSASAQTWHSWFYRFYYRKFGERVPSGSTSYNPNWESILPQILPELEEADKLFSHLILDEAQDIPKELHRILGKLSANSTIFADEKQSLHKRTTTIADIMNAHEVGGNVRYYLTKNYRNTKKILDVARLFYAGDDLPELLQKTGERPTVFRVNGFQGAARLIANFGESNPEKNIGVFVPAWKERENYFETIRDLVEIVNVQQYVSGGEKESHFDFERDGIKILTYNTMKGLEFDAVFLPEIENSYHIEETTNKLNTLYVACSRAKSHLFFFYTDPNAKSFVLSRVQEQSQLVTWEDFTEEEVSAAEDDIPF